MANFEVSIIYHPKFTANYSTISSFEIQCSILIDALIHHPAITAFLYRLVNHILYPRSYTQA